VSLLHVHAPKPVATRCHVIECLTCERPRRMLCRYYEWYGATVVCAGCGETWNDGERQERPFAPGWRKKSIERARGALASIGVQA
jgi:hypothetical protein